jgi:hypothetical protein
MLGPELVVEAAGHPSVGLEEGPPGTEARVGRLEHGSRRGREGREG